MVPGVNTYSLFTVVKPRAGAAVLSLFYFDCSCYMHSKGLRFQYGRMTSPKTLGFIVKNGGDVLA